MATSTWYLVLGGNCDADRAAEEQALRQTCADLASELAHAPGGSYQSAVRRVHAASKRKFGKGQDELSLGELARKKVWLKRCLRAGRLA
ncbi:MAG: hypothetical protein AAFX41_04380 [Bacteroidota bacterium]